MSRIAVVTDSTAYLSPQLIAAYAIQVIPLKIHWKSETYLDGMTMMPAEFYTRLDSDADTPTTSQPSIADFLEIFEQLAPDHDGIIVPLISSGLSGTVDSARAAAAQFSALPVEVLDTRSASAGSALVALAAARAAQAGASLEEVVRTVGAVSRSLGVYFMVDTLKYLHRGGRIGAASRYLGSALNVKPILFMNEQGRIDALERVRTRHKALDRLVELSSEKAGAEPAHVGVMHANAPEGAQFVLEQLKSRIICTESYTFELSPVIGAHVGPGTVGVALYRERESI
jgi:DegV family protein with EDD domain